MEASPSICSTSFDLASNEIYLFLQIRSYLSYAISFHLELDPTTTLSTENNFRCKTINQRTNVRVQF